MTTISASNATVPFERPESYAPPPADFRPLTPGELHAYFRGGEPAADACEALLCGAVRARSAIDVAIAEGLHALRRGDRLAELGCHLDDYAREVLDLGKRAAEGLARLGRELRTRPLLAEALRSGRVRLRAAQTILSVASGTGEASWVEQAGRLTVRELEARVRRATGGASNDDDEAYARLEAALRPDERALVDEALAVAAVVQPGASRIDRLEAIAQEFLGAYPTEADAPSIVARPVAADRREALLEALLEAEAERWAPLPEVGGLPAPEAHFDDMATAHEVKLRLLSRLREDEIAEWTPRALDLTCIALQRQLQGRAERQMCAQGKVRFVMPLRVADVVTAAVQAVCERVGQMLPLGASASPSSRPTSSRPG